MGCGFNSVLKNTSFNFSIEKIDVIGDNNINNNILAGLENYRNNSEEKKYYLKISSTQEKIVTSKDTKGNPKTWTIEIKTIVETSNINKLIEKKEFNEKTSYNTMSSKFDLSLYENIIKTNLAEKIARDISFYLNSLN